MRLLTYLLVSLCLSFVFQRCRTAQSTTRTTPTALISAEGFLTCFEPGLAEGKLWCEASAVLNQQRRIYLANDKDMPAPRSSVFFYPDFEQLNTVAAGNQLPTYLEQPLLRQAHKFEEFAQSPDGRWTFLTTAFDRIKPDTSSFDGYNMLLAWRPGQEGAMRVVSADKPGGASLGLRRQIQAALGGSPYFKIEGLAATNTQLWFGVREQGERYDKFDYRITILTATYRATPDEQGGEKLVLGPVSLVREFKVDDVDPVLPKPLAVSSLEYDPARRCFWLMTSYEQAGQIGAYLWTITELAMRKDGDLQLVRMADKKPLAFSHKAEDMTFIDPNTLLVIHDDDHVKTRIGNQERQPNQTAYSIVRLGF
ncbi:hypothetical protein FAES_2442 [Fibrella aestuarina BUZ 2]|uniref:Esterase-like activity of phytase family protein n=1 Tax=Fibrella aestuarina BUZ 2 TaxID=1166018 RepID=I0K8J8_9BACT|nr:hypothetical protein [Fibrella aestuarina]CCH00451.1 hypothetical protein FAES_2442 [Fibrella aestuarina BUZ 2]